MSKGLHEAREWSIKGSGEDCFKQKDSQCKGPGVRSMSEVFEKVMCEEASMAGAGLPGGEEKTGGQNDHPQGLIIETPRPRSLQINSGSP